MPSLKILKITPREEYEMIKYKVIAENAREMTAVNPESPLWLSWVKWVESDDYLKAKHQLEVSEGSDNFDGALWGVFLAGYVAAELENNAQTTRELAESHDPDTY